MATQNLSVVYKALSSLTPHPHNPRRHPATQRAQLAESIQTFGWTVPILIDEHGTILAGHGRAEVAAEMELENVPTVTITGLTEEQKRAYVLADNKLAENAHWDVPAVLAELEFLTATGIDVEVLGFTDEDLLGLGSMVDDTSFPDSVPGSKISSETEPTMLQGDGNPSLSDVKLEDDIDHTDVPGGNSASDAPFDSVTGESEVSPGSNWLPVALNPVQCERVLEVVMMVMDHEKIDSPTEALVLLAELYAEQHGG